MRIKITKAKLEDLQSVHNIRKRSIESSIDEIYPKYKDYLLKLNSLKNIEQDIKKQVLYIATSSNIIIATLTIDNQTIKGFYVDPIHMNKGIGSLFLDDIEDRLRKKGLKKVELTCNKASIGFYKKKGFIIKKTIKDNELMITRYMMEKIL